MVGARVKGHFRSHLGAAFVDTWRSLTLTLSRGACPRPSFHPLDVECAPAVGQAQARLEVLEARKGSDSLSPAGFCPAPLAGPGQR